MVFRSRFKSLILPIPDEAPTFVHDRWIAVLIAAVGRIAIIPDRLIAYRLHHQQQIGVGKIPLPLRVFVPHGCRSDAIALAALDERLRVKSSCSAHPDFRQALTERQRHIAARSKFSPNPFRRLMQIASEFRSGRYARYPYGPIICIQDLLAGTR